MSAVQLGWCPRASAVLVLTLGLAAPSPAWSSTFVGNPTNFTLGPITGLVITDLYLPISIVEQRKCGASTGVRAAPALVNGRLEFPLRDETCEVRVEFSAAVEVSGYASSGGAPVELELDVPTLVLVFTTTFQVADEDDRYLLELGAPGWTSATALLDGANSVTITPAHAMHDALVDALVAGSALFADTNGNGVLGAMERQAGPLAESAN